MLYHLMASNDVYASPMIIKAKECQPLPSEAFIIPREESESNFPSRVFSQNHCGQVWLVGLTWWEPVAATSFLPHWFSNRGSRATMSEPCGVSSDILGEEEIHLYESSHPCQEVDCPKVGLPAIIFGLQYT